MSQVLTPPRPAVPADLVEHAAREMGVAQAPPYLRRLTVDLRIEAQAADNSFLAPLVVEALQEFVARGSEELVGGKFESKAGLDVTWVVTNEHFENGQRVVLDHGRGQRARPVPLTVAQLEHWGGGDCLVIDGVRYSLAVFKTLANPDPAKRYSFVRQGETVTVVERP